MDSAEDAITIYKRIISEDIKVGQPGVCNMANRVSFSMCLCIFILAACKPDTPTVDINDTSIGTTPTITATQTSNAPDVQADIEAAVLYRTDFEIGYPSEQGRKRQRRA